MARLLSALALAAIVTVGPGCPGQTVIQTINGTPGSQYFGTSVSPIGDADGDGFEDFAVGDPRDPEAGATYAPGGVYVYSGFTGALHHHVQISASSTYFKNFGRSVCGLGDVNGDGRADYAVGANTLGTDFRGRVYVKSGSTGATIWMFDGTVAGGNQGLGRYVDDVGDLNGDGIHDLFVGGTKVAIPETGVAFVLSGATGTPIYSWTGGKAGCRAGDVNADGYQDMMIMREQSSTSVDIIVKSGATGATLFTIAGLQHNTAYQTPFVPRYLSTAGDVTLDGRDDLLIGSVNNVGQTVIQVRSGLNGALIRQIQGSASGSSTFGRDFAPAGDVNGDGRADFAVNSILGVSLYSAITGTVIDTFNTPTLFALESSPCTGRVYVTSTSATNPAIGMRVQALTWTGGQPNGDLARLEINGAGAGSCAGPFTANLPAGGSMTLDWSGPADQPLILVMGPSNPHHAFYFGVGMADIGTPPFYADAVPVLDGTLPWFPHLFFRTDAAGHAQQVFPVPVLPPGPLATVQGLVLQPPTSPSSFILTASFNLVIN